MTTSLFYGDVVYFYHSNVAEATKRGKQGPNSCTGFMHADPCIERVGFQTIGEQGAPPNFQDCLYQILPMLNYDSTEAHQTLSRR